MADATSVDVGGKTVRLTNLTKVLYPDADFAKADVIGFYASVAHAMLPHIAGRALTFTRWPNGVDGSSFFEKNRPSHAPDFVGVADAPGRVRSSVISDAAGLVWAGNQAALEIHVPMALAVDLDTPTAVVFDLDPGAPADLVDCCQIALALREVLGSVGLEAFPKTSGSKGLQVYVPVHGSGTTHEHASSFALAVGQLLSRQHPDRVLVEMAKAKRPGKVFVDWSQNNRAKTTIGVYSLRARRRPTVSTPVTWDEVDAMASMERGAARQFEAAEVIERIDRLGDLFAPVASLEQELPGGG